MLSNDGSVALCMRLASDKKVTLADGTEGYIHKINGHALPAHFDREPEPVIHVKELMSAWKKSTAESLLDNLSKHLCVSTYALHLLGCVWAAEHKAFAFPMRDGDGGMVGIRLRSWSGKKWAVPGSHNALFIPWMPPQSMALVCEGPTSCAAGMSMGFFTIGLPCAGGALTQLIRAIQRLQVRRVVFCADNKKREDNNEDAGLRSCRSMAEVVPVPCVVISPGGKDLRQFLEFGGDRATLQSIINQQIWKNVHN